MPSFEVSGDKSLARDAIPADRPPVPAKRLPVPDAAVQQRIATQIAGIASSSRPTPAERIKLANQLLQAAGASQDANEQYVLLCNVRDLACQGGDLGIMFQAIEAMASQFEMNENDKKGNPWPRLPGSRMPIKSHCFSTPRNE